MSIVECICLRSRDKVGVDDGSEMTRQKTEIILLKNK